MEEEVMEEEVMEEEVATTAILSRARQYLQRGWCQHELAKDADGAYRYPTDTEATSWCVIGAVILAPCDLDLTGARHYWGAVQRLSSLVVGSAVSANLVGSADLVSWNNHPGRTQAEVLRLFDQARGGK